MTMGERDTRGEEGTLEEEASFRGARAVGVTERGRRGRFFLCGVTTAEAQVALALKWREWGLCGKD